MIARVEEAAVREILKDKVSEATEIGKRPLGSAITEARKEAEEKAAREFAKALHTMASEEEARARAEHAEWVEAHREEIDALLAPGVLDRMTERAATIHAFKGKKHDFKALRLARLVVASAQLDLHPNGKPASASAVVSALASRGKNFVFDTASTLFPEGWVYRWESSSPKNLYYAVMDDPDFLRHRFLYPNEIEGIEQIVELLRPLLSSGKAKHIVMMKVDGELVRVELTIHGPVSLAVPTVRNKLQDDQFYTRLLHLDLPDYEGRVREHSRAVSELFSPAFVVADYAEETALWEAAMIELTRRRRVILPGAEDAEFAFDSDQVEHGARLWSNFLGLVASHAWLEQKSRPIVTRGGQEVIVGKPDDYRVVYDLFQGIATRSVRNISDTHRRMLDAIHALNEQKGFNTAGWSQSKVAEKAGLNQGTVSRNVTFLKTSARLLDEGKDRLQLAPGVDPSHWNEDALMAGFPTPEKYAELWYPLEDEDDPDGDGPDDDGGGGVPPTGGEKLPTNRRMMRIPRIITMVTATIPIVTRETAMRPPCITRA